jgi:hypothetical protein
MKVKKREDKRKKTGIHHIVKAVSKNWGGP